MLHSDSASRPSAGWAAMAACRTSRVDWTVHSELSAGRHPKSRSLVPSKLMLGRHAAPAPLAALHASSSPSCNRPHRNGKPPVWDADSLQRSRDPETGARRANRPAPTGRHIWKRIWRRGKSADAPSDAKRPLRPMVPRVATSPVAIPRLGAAATHAPASGTALRMDPGWPRSLVAFATLHLAKTRLR